MRFIRLLIGLLTAITVSFAAAGEKLSASNRSPQQQLQSGSMNGMAGFMERLRATGADVQPAGEVEQPFFSVIGTMLKIHGEDVQVFQYATAAAAAAESAPISPDGMGVGSSKIHWIGSPHFFKKDRLLVLYVGDNARVLITLEALLGHQFAGR